MDNDDDSITENMYDLIIINDLVSYLEQCVLNNRHQQAKLTIDRIIRLLQLLKFNMDVSD